MSWTSNQPHIQTTHTHTHTRTFTYTHTHVYIHAAAATCAGHVLQYSSPIYLPCFFLFISSFRVINLSI